MAYNYTHLSRSNQRPTIGRTVNRTHMFTVDIDTPGMLCSHLEFADRDIEVWGMTNYVEVSLD